MTWLYFGAVLGLTLIIEETILLLSFRDKKVMYAGFLGNLLTNPALNLILLLALHYFEGNFYWGLVIFLECGAVLAEGKVFRLVCGMKAKKAFLLSVLINAASFAAGFALMPFMENWLLRG